MNTQTRKSKTQVVEQPKLKITKCPTATAYGAWQSDHMYGLGRPEVLCWFKEIKNDRTLRYYGIRS